MVHKQCHNIIISCHLQSFYKVGVTYQSISLIHGVLLLRFTPPHRLECDGMTLKRLVEERPEFRTLKCQGRFGTEAMTLVSHSLALHSSRFSFID